jgi:hypothetical protein
MNNLTEDRKKFNRQIMDFYTVKDCKHKAVGQRMIADDSIGIEYVNYCEDCGIDLI